MGSFCGNKRRSVVAAEQLVNKVSHGERILERNILGVFASVERQDVGYLEEEVGLVAALQSLLYPGIVTVLLHQVQTVLPALRATEEGKYLSKPQLNS